MCSWFAIICTHSYDVSISEAVDIKFHHQVWIMNYIDSCNVKWMCIYKWLIMKGYKISYSLFEFMFTSASKQSKCQLQSKKNHITADFLHFCMSLKLIVFSMLFHLFRLFPFKGLPNEIPECFASSHLMTSANQSVWITLKIFWNIFCKKCHNFWWIFELKFALFLKLNIFYSWFLSILT